MKNNYVLKLWLFLVFILLALGICSCSGGGNGGNSTGPYTLSGTTTGLDFGESLSIIDNYDTKNTLIINKIGFFFLHSSVVAGSNYDITITKQPANETCTVNNGQGVNINQNITDLKIVCSKVSYTVAGTISGLSSNQSISLVNNGDTKNTLIMIGSGNFTLPVAIALGGNYSIVIAKQSANETCTINNGSGVDVKQNITDITIVCSSTQYTVSGTVSGLDAGQSVSLVNNKEYSTGLTETKNGNFIFATPMAPGGHYAVTIATQPQNQTCTVNNASGVINQNVTNITVVCSGNKYTLGGTVSGLVSGERVSLVNNGDTAGATIISRDGGFTLPPVAFQSNYTVTIANGGQPANETCSVSYGQGINVSSNINDIVVKCGKDPYTLGGTVTGLDAGQSVTIANAGDLNNSITVSQSGSANLPFTLPKGIAFQSNYNVAVVSGGQPANERCSVGPTGQGSDISANITNIEVICSKDTYTLGGNVHGLISGQSVSLVNNGDFSNYVTIPQDESFTFPGKLPYQSSYSVTIAPPGPTGEACVVGHHKGIITGNIDSLDVTCSTSSFSINVVATGIPSGQNITLLNNDADPLQISTSGKYTFKKQIPSGGSYSITLQNEPANLVCKIVPQEGENVTATVNVQLTCATVGNLSYNSYSINQYQVDGATPQAGLTLNPADGNFYGVTSAGGNNGNGMVFKISPTTGVETVLYSFGAKTNDGSAPEASLTLYNGNFYGTTNAGGASGNGTVFEITPEGAETVLYSFGAKSNDAANPQASLTLVGGDFYGTTNAGGTSGNGTVFKINPTTQFEAVLHNFGDGSVANDGTNPQANLTLYNGNLYGTTSSGGANSSGTAFQINPITKAEKVLHSFGDGSITTFIDGVKPQAGLTLYNGNFYGTTSAGGGGGTNGTGTVFEMTPSGNETQSYSFGTNSNDGSAPQANLILSGSNFYGTTSSSNNNNGTVFKINATLAPSTEQILYNFDSSKGSNGSIPKSDLVLYNGDLYGTTSAGGASSLGTIFSITSSGTAETVLHSFSTTNYGVANPVANLTLGSDGNFYGTTYAGGSVTSCPNANPNPPVTSPVGCGTVFKMTPSGVETVLHNFGLGSDGANPYASLILGPDGKTFYGTTYAGGSGTTCPGGCGTVFEITSSGAENVLYSFTGGSDGSNPAANLILYNGNFYGTTSSGGNDNNGTVFEITPSGGKTVLYRFGPNGSDDGAVPLAGLILGADSNFYGTTFNGGIYSGNGTVFKITPNGAESVIHNFGTGSDGANPRASLTLGNDGSFYGTTSGGGTGNFSANGTVFKITPNGTESVIYNFGVITNDGNTPDANLILGSDGNFYGTTSTGGYNFSTNGTIFEITPSGIIENVLYSFGSIGSSDGNNPQAGITLGADGNLYGTASVGGTVNDGTVFKLGI